MSSKDVSKLFQTQVSFSKALKSSLFEHPNAICIKTGLACDPDHYTPGFLYNFSPIFYSDSLCHFGWKEISQGDQFYSLSKPLEEPNWQAHSTHGGIVFMHQAWMHINGTTDCAERPRDPSKLQGSAAFWIKPEFLVLPASQHILILQLSL